MRYAILCFFLTSCAHAPVIATAKFRVHVAQPNARVFIDSRPISRSDNNAVDTQISVGPHRLMVVADGFYRAYFDIDLKSTDGPPLEVDLRPVPPGEVGD